MMKESCWGYLRETAADAVAAGTDPDTGLCRTGLDRYLAVIFPEIKESEWVHDKKIQNAVVDGKALKSRPDYRCEKLKLIVEFDGLQHYQDPLRLKKDIENTRNYQRLGYMVVRIPCFIQLTNAAVKTLFGVDVTPKLFDGRYASMGEKGKLRPSVLCPSGLERMAYEFLPFREQYATNLKALESVGDDFLTGVSYLKTAYENAKREAKSDKYPWLEKLLNELR